MSLLDSLQKDMVAAMKAKDKNRLKTVRMLKAAVKDSLEESKAAGRDDSVQELEGEIAVVQGYMPAQLSADDVKAVVEETIKAVGATSKADFGKVMGAVMPKLKGKADGKLINATVKELLG